MITILIAGLTILICVTLLFGEKLVDKFLGKK
jgi:hypothetical protein